MKMLTDMEAFQAMRQFLEAYYERTQAPDIGALLGDLQQHDDGTTFDPAAWSDWLEAVNLVDQSRR